MKRTVLGLRVSFAGENPEALDAAGVSINKISYLAVALSGLLAGWGGEPFAFPGFGLFAEYGGRPRIHGPGGPDPGKWRPPYAVLACLFFGRAGAGV